MSFTTDLQASDKVRYLACERAVIGNDNRQRLCTSDQTSLEYKQWMTALVTQCRLGDYNVWQVAFTRQFKRQTTTFWLVLRTGLN